MTDAELQMIEEELGFVLPSFYKATMRNYPFAGEAEPMLSDDPRDVIDLNIGGLELEGVGCPFFVGNDKNEKVYFLDAVEPLSPVYCSEGETGRHAIQAGSWGKYLSQIRQSRKARGLDTVGIGQAAGKWWPF
ncbi:MAG TPA: hypothetical protein VLH60_06575 [Sedimentisphaerales bacterium]|nr:hypothetical protein [Sedimentisphaerales bacterium]